MKNYKIPPEEGKRYILRNGTKTSKVYLDKNGTNYIYSAKTENGDYIFSWLKDGSYLTSKTDCKYDIIKEMK